MIEIQPATPDDAALILQFIRGLAEYEREPKAVQVNEATLSAQMSMAVPPFESLIAHCDGAPAGFALYFPTYSTWLGKPGLWLEDLFVIPEFRGRGLGKALLARVAEIAHQRHCGRLEWSVLDWNQPAIDFYRRAGAEVLDGWRICRISGETALEQLASAGQDGNRVSQRSSA